MLLSTRPLDLQDMRDFPLNNWNVVDEQWETLCDQLDGFEPPARTLVVKNLNRKWELVSAYQKCVRRSLGEMAQQLVGAFMSFSDKELAYFWRRICTTACEDVGYASPMVMNFVVAASKVYPAKVGRGQLYKIWSYLTKLMCEQPRSRIYCQLSIIEGIAKQLKVCVNDWEGWEAFLLHRLLEPQSFSGQQRVWAMKNSWRGEGMLKYQNLDLSDLQIAVKGEALSYEMIYGLPDFAYDMHTRIGQGMCQRLCGHCKPFFAKNSPNNKLKVIGWALFMREGGWIKDCRYDARLDKVEGKFIAAKFGWTPEQWWSFFAVIDDALSSGIVNSLRRHLGAQQTDYVV